MQVELIKKISNMSQNILVWRLFGKYPISTFPFDDLSGD